MMMMMVDGNVFVAHKYFTAYTIIRI